MLQRVLLLASLLLFLGCSSPKKAKDSEIDPPPPAERKLLLKGGAVEMKLNDEEKIRVKPNGGGAVFELILDY
ncbi:MAG: hypothetical protein WCL41_02180 [Betaproteobacteria bacterium]